MKNLVKALAIVLLLSVSACDLFNWKDEEPEVVVLPDPVPRVVADSLFTVLESGLKYYDFVVGQGTPVGAGASVVLDYNAWLSDSTLVDSSILRGVPASFTLNESQVILGWVEGVATMRRGGERQLIIPPDLAYGDIGSSVVPPGATLIFEIKLY
ncbi:MAG: FKBP-type peptidyl-prolyl cis-trans isomerase [Rhodothermales bacterium]